MTDQTFRPTSATVDTDHATNELVLRFSTFNPETRDMDTIVVRLAELDGIAFAGETARHLCAVVNGVVRDTYDPSRCGTRCVYGYWTAPGGAS